MTAVRLAWLELRRFRGPVRRFVPVLLCLIPLLYGATYLWANWDPYGKTDKIPVAVVDQDRLAHGPQGQRVEAGKQLVQQLKAGGEFDWRFVDANRAHRGLEDGDYYFTITVPRDFSSSLATAGSNTPRRAGIRIELNDAHNYIAGIMTQVVRSKLQDQVDSAAHAAYVRGVYGELSSIKGRLKTAADGANALVAATGTAQSGSSTLASGLSTLQGGASQIASGASRISQAISQVDSALDGLDKGAAQTLPDAANALVTAADLAAQGAGAVHTGTTRAKKDSAQVVTDLTDLATAHPELRQDAAYQRAVRDAGTASSTAAQIDAQAATADHEANQALTHARSVQATAGTVQSKILAAGTPLHLVDSGASSVATGASTVSSGLSTLQQGAGSLKSAADQAHGGATKIAGIVNGARKSLPATDPDQVARAADVLSSPTHITSGNLHPAGVYGRGLAPFFFGIALWVFGLFAYLLLRPVNLRALAGRVHALTVAVAGWLPGAALGATASLVLYGVVDLTLGLDPVHPLLILLLLPVGAGAFVAVDHFLRTALGVPGDVLSLVLLIVQLTAAGGLYPMPTEPAPFQAVRPFLPMTYLIDGLRVTISGGSTGRLATDLGVLAGFAAVFLCAGALTVRRLRTWTVARLHPDVEL